MSIYWHMFISILCFSLTQKRYLVENPLSSYLQSGYMLFRILVIPADTVSKDKDMPAMNRRTWTEIQLSAGLGLAMRYNLWNNYS